MKKSEILKHYRVDKMDNSTVFIANKHFNFSYTKKDDIIKDEFKDKYRYFGGLQSGYHEDSIEYKNLENWLCGIAEMILKF